MENESRLFQFEGHDFEYIDFLERSLLEAQGQLLEANNQLPSGLMTPISSSSLSRPQTPKANDKWDFMYYCPNKGYSRKPPTISNSHWTRGGRSKGEPTRQSKRKGQQWETELTNFISSIPTEHEWETKRASFGFHTAESNRRAIQLMLGTPATTTTRPGNSEMTIPYLSPEDNTDMIFKACRFGQLANDCTANGRFVILVGKYQKLIFICACTILLYLGSSKQTINWMMRQYISDSDDKNLERYRAGCIWVNHSISRLLLQGWGYKSWEIFLLCGRSAHQYGRFSDSRKSLEMFSNQLGKMSLPIFESGYIPYCIPCIIKVLLGDDVELTQICDCLGYDAELINQIYHSFFASLPIENHMC